MEHGKYRFIRLVGRPAYASTYRNWDMKLARGAVLVERPQWLSIIVRETERGGTDGVLSYVDAFEDEELGLKEPTQFAFEADYPLVEFDRLWSVLSNPFGKLCVSVSVRAPRTDSSGHYAVFDVSEESSTWPADGLYASRSG